MFRTAACVCKQGVGAIVSQTETKGGENKNDKQMSWAVKKKTQHKSERFTNILHISTLSD